VDIKLAGLILVSVAISAIAQLALKLGMSNSAVQFALGQGDRLQAALAVATNLHVIVGLSLYALGAVLWLMVLARVDLSFAYPFVGLGFVFTMILGWWVLGESIGAARVAGTFLVIAGVWLVSSS
jgi:drug/metabolite transporter (DMT)-like permease